MPADVTAGAAVGVGGGGEAAGCVTEDGVADGGGADVSGGVGVGALWPPAEEAAAASTATRSNRGRPTIPHGTADLNQYLVRRRTSIR